VQFSAVNRLLATLVLKSTIQRRDYRLLGQKQ